MTSAFLKHFGNEAESKEVLTILVMTGNKESKCIWRSQVGIGSRSHDLGGDDDIIFEISSSDAGESTFKVHVGVSTVGTWVWSGVEGISDESRAL